MNLKKVQILEHYLAKLLKIILKYMIKSPLQIPFEETNHEKIIKKIFQKRGRNIKSIGNKRLKVNRE